ncbi:MAG TPA: serine hydrolase [Nannocystaceae bacterium]|nr:serine hydrolase [Nannocystaceae bacterium]
MTRALAAAPALAAVLALALAAGCRPPAAGTTDPNAATPTPAAAKPDAGAARLERLAARIDTERERLGVPGLALVVVRDGEVVLARGFGERAVDRPAKVDADTLFAIGSTTKAFTAMLVMMAVEAGKIALDDHPRKCLPEFGLRDPKADAALRIRDLLTHTSGLMGTDLGWYTGKLSRAELLQLVREAEPVAPPHTEFHYQNVMYVAAGECAAKALGGEYEALLRSRILAKIGMAGANTSVATTLASANHSAGHHRRGDDSVHEVPMRTLDAVAPAVAINASAAMMAGWLKVMLAGGKVGGERLLSEKHFAELLAPQFPAGPGLEYTLGWVRAQHGAHQVFEHTGGIDGFSSLVTLVPERKLGFALLTNVDHSDIHGFVTHEVMSLLAEEQAAKRPTVASVDEAGTYGVLGGFKIEVVREGERIAMRVPGQPTYPLEHVEGRRYRLGPPAPPGFFATFRPRKDEPVTGPKGPKDDRAEIWLEQPFGDIALPELSADEIAAAASAEPPPEQRELLGTYRARGEATEFQLATVDGRIALVVAGQPPAPLQPIDRDRFALVGLPAGFDVQVRRDGSGKPSGLLLQRPDSVTELVLVASTAAPAMSVDEVLARRARAHGSAKLSRRKSMVVESELVFVHQGLRGTSTTWREAPARYAEDVRIVAFGREIGSIRSGWDGQAAFQAISFAPEVPLERDQVRALELEAPFDGWAATVRPGAASVTARSKIDDVPVVVVRFVTDWGATITDSLDAKRFVVLRRELELPTGTPGSTLRETRTYSDYRKVKGVLVPHRIVTESTNGTVIATVKRVQFDAPVPTDAFSRTSSGPTATATR